MKQVLLRIPTVFAKIGFRKFTQLLRRYFLPAREILLSQNALDPDVDWECAEPLVSKEHHAVCDLRAHTRQIAQVIPKTALRKHRPCFEITFAGTNKLCCRAQVFGTITKLAFAQLTFGSSGNSLRRRKRVHRAIPDFPSVTEAIPKRQRNLPDVGDLFHR